MRNPIAVKASSPEGEDIPREIYGFRPYLLAISASWACEYLLHLNRRY